MLYLLTLPFRLLFGLIAGIFILGFAFLIVPIFLLRVLIKSVVLLVALPFVLLALGGGLLLAFLAILFVLMIPLLPVAFLALCIWAIARLASRPALTY